MDTRTIAFYDAEAARFADMNEEMFPAGGPHLARFIEMLPARAAVLDFGAGSGWFAHWLGKAGHRVHATDASPGLARLAAERYGVAVEVMAFEALDADAAYDGIWCSFSLLHDTREALPGHLARLARAAKPGAALYLGMKEGEGSRRDHHGRRYIYVTEPGLAGLLADAGFSAPEIERGTGACLGKPENFFHAYARRLGG